MPSASGKSDGGHALELTRTYGLLVQVLAMPAVPPRQRRCATMPLPPGLPMGSRRHSRCPRPMPHLPSEMPPPSGFAEAADPAGCGLRDHRRRAGTASPSSDERSVGAMADPPLPVPRRCRRLASAIGRPPRGAAPSPRLLLPRWKDGGAAYAGRARRQAGPRGRRGTPRVPIPGRMWLECADPSRCGSDARKRGASARLSTAAAR